jgi:hypothetical protein
MKARIGIAETDMVIEVEFDDVKAFKKEIERAVASAEMAWFVDSKGRTVGVPSKSIAYIEVEDSQTAKTVGFGPVV